MRSLGALRWLFASLALHTWLVLWVALGVTPLANAVAERERHDVWHGALIDVAHAPDHPKPSRAEQASPEREADRGTTNAAPPPEDTREPQQSPSPQTFASKPAAPKPPHSPAEPPREKPPTVKDARHDEHIDSTEPRDELVERLMAAERRKAEKREREAKEREAAAAQVTHAQPLTTPGGAESDLPRGVRSLGTAFTRAIPYATNSDARWQSHRAGYVGRLEVLIVLENGAVARTEIKGEPALLLRELERRTVLLLKSGRFALPNSNAQTGSQKLEIEVTLSNKPKQSSLTLGFTPPTKQKAGEAYFTLASGRHFSAKVRLLP